MKIGIYGGSFNPPHVAHLVVAETMREQFELDRVLWVPSHRPPHKESETLASAKDRIAMVRLACKDNSSFDVSDIELHRDGPSYTLDTIRELQDAHPNAHYHLIIGGDTLLQFGSWHEPDEIVRRVPLLVYRRPGSDLRSVDERFLRRTRIAVSPMMEVSGESLRARITAGMSTRYLIPEAVRAYIARHGLYR